MSLLVHLLRRALTSGTLAAAAVTVAAGVAGRRAAGSYAAPLNATSHVLWGAPAARHDRLSLKYTGTGAAANYGACLFWALGYEALGQALGSGRRRRPLEALARGALVSATAYVVDYHLMPRRLTPGFELRLPGAALAAIFAALALGLSARDLRNRP